MIAKDIILKTENLFLPHNYCFKPLQQENQKIQKNEKRLC